MDAESDGKSKRTVQTREYLLGKLFGWLDFSNHDKCGYDELRTFFHYLATAHDSIPGGSWSADGVPLGVDKRTTLGSG